MCGGGDELPPTGRRRWVFVKDAKHPQFFPIGSVWLCVCVCVWVWL